MSRAHTPNGLLVDPIYAKMRCRPLCVSPPPVPEYEAPEIPRTTVNEPPRAPSALTPDGNLVLNDLPTQAMAVGTDGAIDVFVAAFIGNEPSCPIEGDRYVGLNVTPEELAALSVVIGVAMFSYADRILTHYQPAFTNPSGTLHLLTDRSGEDQQYEWERPIAGGFLDAVTTNSVNGTTAQTQITGDITGLWIVGANHDGQGTPTAPLAQLEVHVQEWGPVTAETYSGVMGTGISELNEQKFIIHGPIPERLKLGIQAIIEDRCGNSQSLTLAYNSSLDELWAPAAVIPEGFKFISLPE